ncbi:MAG: hypothetical protein GY819_06180 [Planctomycetaceae bacterium]|nr:hypothetical protein [Planctomycetaceae bacterium]
MRLPLVAATVLLAIQAPQLATAQCNTTFVLHTFDAPKSVTAANRSDAPPRIAQD